MRPRHAHKRRREVVAKPIQVPCRAAANAANTTWCRTHASRCGVSHSWLMELAVVAAHALWRTSQLAHDPSPSPGLVGAQRFRDLLASQLMQPQEQQRARGADKAPAGTGGARGAAARKAKAGGVAAGNAKAGGVTAGKSKAGRVAAGKVNPRAAAGQAKAGGVVAGKAKGGGVDAGKVKPRAAAGQAKGGGVAAGKVKAGGVVAKAALSRGDRHSCHTLTTLSTNRRGYCAMCAIKLAQQATRTVKHRMKGESLRLQRPDLATFVQSCCARCAAVTVWTPVPDS